MYFDPLRIAAWLGAAVYGAFILVAALAFWYIAGATVVALANQIF